MRGKKHRIRLSRLGTETRSRILFKIEADINTDINFGKVKVEISFTSTAFSFFCQRNQMILTVIDFESWKMAKTFEGLTTLNRHCNCIDLLYLIKWPLSVCFLVTSVGKKNNQGLRSTREHICFLLLCCTDLKIEKRPSLLTPCLFTQMETTHPSPSQNMALFCISD